MFTIIRNARPIAEVLFRIAATRIEHGELHEPPTITETCARFQAQASRPEIRALHPESLAKISPSSR
jgi:hypothetical protein